jgi:curli biogenesis system outer membrane secretion channel CsgG
MVRIPVLLLAAAAAGCASSSAQVVSSSSGPTIREAQTAPYNGPKQRIVVSSFSGGPSGIGQGLSDMLIDSLVNTNRFIVLERERLNEVTAEQQLSRSRDFKQETAVPQGQMEGAQLLVRGSVTEFEENCKGGSAIVVSAKQACIAINLRIIDAATGRVVNATTVQGTSNSSGVGLVYTQSTLPIGLGVYSKTPMEAAIRNCIETAVRYIADTKM